MGKPGLKILLYSPNFFPLTGGLEQVAMDLATEFSALGHSVTLLTMTPATAVDTFPFRVLRGPGWWRQWWEMRNADVVLQLNVSLKGILPWLLSGRPLVISHQTAHWNDWRGRLKTWVARHWASLNIGCSRYMAEPYPRSVAIPNPYRDELFYVKTPWVAREQELIFAGRLVSDKGVDLLLQALANVRREGLQPRLTIVGEGSERPSLEALVQALDLSAQVEFAGLRHGEQLAALLNAHRIMVVPSRWAEPFGIVALEGLASGCLLLGSSGGGLGEAIGPFGLLFPNGDLAALTAGLKTALAATAPAHSPALQAHLQRHRKKVVAQAYLTALNSL